jgi:hypothetical protein
MKLSYTDANGQKQVYPHDFISVREAIYIAANTGYILDAKELHISCDMDVKKPVKNTGGKKPEDNGNDGGEAA